MHIEKSDIKVLASHYGNYEQYVWFSKFLFTPDRIIAIGLLNSWTTGYCKSFHIHQRQNHEINLVLLGVQKPFNIISLPG